MNHCQLVAIAKLIRVFLAILWCLGATQGITVLEAEEKLLEKLYGSSYKHHALPIINPNQPVKVMFDLNLRQICEVDEVTQTIKLTVWLRIYWNNPLLTWNKANYANIDSIHVDKDEVWYPDIVLYNEIVTRENTRILYERLPTKILVNSNGNCEWFAPAILLSQCNIDVTEFPYDQHQCPLTFGSWAYHESQLNITYINDNVNLNNYIAHNRWELVGSRFSREIMQAQHGTKVYPNVSLKLNVKRRPMNLVLNLIVPCILISALSFLSFILPTGHGERITLNVTVLLVMVIYMLIMFSTMPQSSQNAPRMSVYLMCIIIELALCVVATCVSMKVGCRDGEMPEWLNSMFGNSICRVFALGDGKHSDSYDVSDRGYENSTFELTSEVPAKDSIPSENPQRWSGKHEPYIYSQLFEIAGWVREKQRRKERIAKWKSVAKVLDRLFLFIFVVVFVVLVVIFFA